MLNIISEAPWQHSPGIYIKKWLRACKQTRPSHIVSVAFLLSNPVRAAHEQESHVCLACGRFGNTCLMHLEDMSFENLGRLFARYRGTFPCFSDDVQARPSWSFSK